MNLPSKLLNLQIFRSNTLKVIPLTLIFLGLTFALSIYCLLIPNLGIKTPFNSDPFFFLPIGRSKSSLILLGTSISFFILCFAPIKYKQRLPLNSSFYLCSGAFLGIFSLNFTSWADSAYAYPERIRFDVYFFYSFLLCFLLTRLIPRLISKIILLSYFLIFLTFLAYTKGQGLFTDDHASVIYRLHLLSEHFPAIPVYNTVWNAGTDWRDFFATGILNVFFLFYPLIKILGSLSAYQFIIPALLFIIFPLSMFYSAKILGLNRLGQSLAVFLGLTSNVTLYKWTFSFGSLGFVCSAILLPLAFSSLLKIVSQIKEKNPPEVPNLKASDLAFSATVCTLVCFWSLQVITLLPMLLIFLWFSFKSIVSSKKLAAIALFFIVINICWALVFIKVSKVDSFLTVEKSKTFEVSREVGFSRSYLRHGAQALNFEKPFTIFKENLMKMSPLVVVFSLLSLLTSSLSPIKRISFTITIGWLFALGLLGPLYKPQLELDRFILLACVLAVIPVSSLLSDVFKNQDQKNSLPTAILSAFILTSTFSFSSIFQSRGWDNFYLTPPELKKLASAISTHVGEGRALFSGFILHDLGGGHLGPLAQFSNAPLVGSSPVHNLWRYTDVIPAHYRDKGEDGYEEYFTLMNATLVLAHEKKWNTYLSSRPDIYNKIEQVGKFTLYKRRIESNYFIKGSGEILSQLTNKLVLKLDSSSAIIKFNYYSFLKVEGCNHIQSYGELDSLKFIALAGCELNQEITISSINPIARIFR